MRNVKISRKPARYNPTTRSTEPEKAFGATSEVLKRGTFKVVKRSVIEEREVESRVANILETGDLRTIFKDTQDV